MKDITQEVSTLFITMEGIRVELLTKAKGKLATLNEPLDKESSILRQSLRRVIDELEFIGDEFEELTHYYVPAMLPDELLGDTSYSKPYCLELIRRMNTHWGIHTRLFLSGTGIPVILSPKLPHELTDRIAFMEIPLNVLLSTTMTEHGLIHNPYYQGVRKAKEVVNQLMELNSIGLSTYVECIESLSSMELPTPLVVRHWVRSHTKPKHKWVTEEVCGTLYQLKGTGTTTHEMYVKGFLHTLVQGLFSYGVSLRGCVKQRGSHHYICLDYLPPVMCDVLGIKPL